MYTLPDDFDLLLLSGCYLEMVSFAAATTRLDFSRPQVNPGMTAYGVSICVEGGLKYKLADVSGSREFTDSSTCAPLIDFLLKDVLSIEKLSGSTLRIIFISGDEIIIEGDSCHDYELYTIYLDTGDIIIV